MEDKKNKQHERLSHMGTFKRVCEHVRDACSLGFVFHILAEQKFEPIDNSVIVVMNARR